MSRLQQPLIDFLRHKFPGVVFREPRRPNGEDGWEVEWETNDLLQHPRIHFALDCFVAGWLAARDDKTPA